MMWQDYQRKIKRDRNRENLKKCVGVALEVTAVFLGMVVFFGYIIIALSL